MFGLFRKKARLVREPDRVFVSRHTADDALLGDAVGLCDQGAPVIVASFFGGSLGRIGAALERAGRKARSVEARALPPLPLAAASPVPLLTNVASLGVDFALSSWLLRAEQPFRVLFVEHYPSFEAERHVLDVLEECSAKQALTVRFHVGLDEPLMQVFGGARVAQLMESMGMAPGEAIEHPLVDRAIVNAQKKLDKRVPAPQPADTDLAWFELNLGRTIQQ